MMNHRNKTLKRLEKRLGRRGRQNHDEGEGLPALEGRATARYALGSINDIRVDEENMEEEEKIEETDESTPASASAGAHAVNQQGEVRRGSAQAGGDDISIAIESDLETVQSDPMPPPPPMQGNDALLVEAHLVEPTDNAEDVREQRATLEQENMRLRNKVPLVQAEVAQESARNKGPRRKCFIVLGVTAALVTVAVAVGVSVAGGGGAFSPPTSSPSTLVPASWQLVGQVLHGETAVDLFGTSICLSSSGNIMAVGAAQTSNPGYVVVNRYNPATQQWVQIGQELVGQARGDKFGESVSLNSDGTILAVGAPWNDSGGTNAGHVRVFEHDSASDQWVQLGSDIQGQSAGDHFGFSVSLSGAGDILAVGAVYDDTKNGTKCGSVRLFQYDRGSSSWSHLGQTLFGQADDDRFGFSVSLSQLGTIVGVGAPHNESGVDTAGQVSVFEYNFASSSWDLLGDPINGPVDRGYLGHSVSLDDSGLIMAVGAANGSERVLVHSYDRSTSAWNQCGQTLSTRQPGDWFGGSVSLSGNGDVLAVGSRAHEVDGSSYVGQVRIFQRNSNATKWNRLGDPLNGVAEFGNFGNSVSLSANGSIVGVGARFTDVNGEFSGSVYVFKSNIA